jgi:TolB-like protein/DNA-binding winged helix-turn-helix (wHTH) protein/Flp pilus assembly protein TadD
MTDRSTVPESIRFGPFEVSPYPGELRKHGIRLKVSGQAIEVLLILLESPGRIVSREELQRKLWPGTNFGDFYHGLNAAVNRLREVLGDSATQPKFIETVPRHGYRFIGEIEAAQSIVSTADVPGQNPPAGKQINKDGTRSWRKVALVLPVIPLAVIFALNVGGWRTHFLTRSRSLGLEWLGAQNPPIRSVAVLPLENLSGDSGQEYFADGITEALTTELGKVSALRVISRQSVMRYKGSKEPLPEIARELGVEALVEGSVIRSGHRVAVTANLVEASSEKHIWSERFDRNLDDMLSVQSDFAQAIAREVNAKLTPAERARFGSRHVVNPDAYEVYLKGRYFLQKVGEQERLRALRYFEQAIEIDPDDALAYAGIAQVYGPLGYCGYISPAESDSKMEWAATKALELDDSIAEAHAALGLARSVHEWDWPMGEREFRRAIDLNPGYATAHSWYAQILMMTGRTEESLAENNQAEKLDPLSPGRYALLAEQLTWAGQYDQAIEKCNKALELEPSSATAHLRLGIAYEAKKDYEKAIAELEKARDLSDRSAYFLRSLGHAYAEARRRGQAHQVLLELREYSKRRYVSPFSFALVYTGLGDREEAFDWLEEAYQQRDPSLSTMRRDPRLDPLRSDPRFRDLLRRVRLGQ